MTKDIGSRIQADVYSQNYIEPKLQPNTNSDRYKLCPKDRGQRANTSNLYVRAEIVRQNLFNKLRIEESILSSIIFQPDEKMDKHGCLTLSVFGSQLSRENMAGRLTQVLKNLQLTSEEKMKYNAIQVCMVARLKQARGEMTYPLQTLANLPTRECQAIWSKKRPSDIFDWNIEVD